LYNQTGQVLSEAHQKSLAGLSKLSLFDSQEPEASPVSDELIMSWLGVTSDIFYIRKIESGDIILWEIFATYVHLIKLIETELIVSNIDYILWPDNWTEPPKLLVFDMDSTFIEIEVIDELARQHGVGTSVSKVTEAAMRGELDFSESLISRVACLENLAESAIKSICKNLPLSRGIAQLIEHAKANHIKIVIVSGGFAPFVDHIKQQLSIYRVRANQLEVNNGFLTGKLVGPIIDAQAKADFVNELKIELGLESNEIMTIGDGANDLLMMRESGFSLAYRAKPAVQEKAKGRMNQTHLNHLINVFEW